MRQPFRVLIALVLAAVVAAGGCAGATPKAGGPSTTVQSSTTIAVTARNDLVTASKWGKNIPQDVPNQVAERPNVTMNSCKATHGGWSAAGSAVNHTTTPVSYLITIFFTTDHAQDVGVATAKITVAAGKAEPWSATASTPESTPIRCVLRGVATT